MMIVNAVPQKAYATEIDDKQVATTETTENVTPSGISYVNKCGLHIVEPWNERHIDPNMEEDFVGDGDDGMFRFQKQM